MQDRTPTPGQEGRALITPEDGSPAYYAKIVMADNPSQEGTPYDKSNVLKDETCDAIGIPHTSTPNEAFLALALGVGRYGYIIHVVLPDGSPVEGATITGGTTPSGGSPVTDANGVAIIVSNSESVSISISSPFADIKSAADVSINSTGILTSQTVTLPYNEDVQQILTSQTVKYSVLAKFVDVCAVGGGAGGAGGVGLYGGSPNAPGGGGSGGYVQNSLLVALSGSGDISVQVGAGGSAGTGNSTGDADLTVGGTGGTTTVSIPEMGFSLSANGGTSSPAPAAGIGNGNGGVSSDNIHPEAGSDGTGYIFGEAGLGLAGGGGGSSGKYSRNSSVANGGLPKGGSTGSAGESPGGGGSGGYQRDGSGSNGFAGGNGGAYLRFHH